MPPATAIDTAEAGLPKVDAAPDFGIVAPANLPPAILAQLAAAAQSALKSDEVRRRFDEIGYQSIGSTPRDIIAILQSLKSAGALESEIEVI